jgi:hypothetical protein
MGDELESEVSTCGIADDLDILRLNSSGHKVFQRRYSLFELSGKYGGWDEGLNKCK